jgi:hypothetical protein
MVNKPKLLSLVTATALDRLFLEATAVSGLLCALMDFLVTESGDLARSLIDFSKNLLSTFSKSLEI